MPGTPLSLRERHDINTMLIADRSVSWAAIARELGRHATTVMREVTMNGGRGRYRPATADRRASTCRKRPRTRRLAQPGVVRDRIQAELRNGRSPDAIWLDLDAEQVEGRPCTETIYTSIYNGALDVRASDCLRTRRRRRRSRQQRRPNKRAGLPNIGARPASVDERTTPGDWEVDQIIGAHNRSSMLWLSERVTRFSIGIATPPGYSGEAVLAGLVEACEQIPTHLRRSFTFDQGSEWCEWETLAATYDCDVWFCDPHAPWQRGQIENLTRQWRWWFPRGTDLGRVAQADIDHAATIINGQRRRHLDNQSPAHLYADLTVQ